MDVKRLQPPDGPNERVRLRVRARNGTERDVDVRQWLFFGERVHADGYLEPEPVGER